MSQPRAETSISSKAAKSSLRSMDGLTDCGCACKTAGAVGALKDDIVRGGGMGGIIQPKNNHAEESGDIASKCSR